MSGAAVRTHGMSHLPEYDIWYEMVRRCTNPKNRKYRLYGGRGIQVYPAWLASFPAFFAYVGPRPSNEYSLDRYPDKDGNYEPGNVRWATVLEQNRNTNHNRMLTFLGRTACVTEWAEFLGINKKTLDRRLRLGWSLYRALSPRVMTPYESCALASARNPRSPWKSNPRKETAK